LPNREVPLKILFSILMIAAFSSQSRGQEAPVKLDWTDFRGGVYRTDNLILAGQLLSEKAMAKLALEGVTTIINLRTPLEMADKESTPIDESELAKRHGIRYVQVPSGGSEHPLSNKTVEEFSDVYANSKGLVLLHCNSGRRATHLWVAYLVDHQGMNINQAISLGRSANFGYQPFEGYLEGELEYRKKAP
jgi:uncharacterized protein (TIGR01244 family)